MKTRPYHDTRHTRRAEDKPASVKIAINHGGSSGYVSTGISILPGQWDGTTVVKHPNSVALNVRIRNRWNDVDKALEELRKEGGLKGLNASAMARLVEERLDQGDIESPDLFLPRLRAYIERQTKQGTIITYKQTEKKVVAFCESVDPKTGKRKSDPEALRFSDINQDWLGNFDKWMAGTAPGANARNIHLRNIRTVFNDALADGATTAFYPFRKFKIVAAATPDRSMSIDEIRRLFLFEGPDWLQYYVDMFKLSFLLCGINIVDLAKIRKLNRGRVEFSRTKTGVPVSVLVQPEAARIIEKHKGDGYLVSISNRVRNYKDFLHRMNDALQKIGTTYNVHTKKREGEAEFPDLTSYSARYSWATLAAELDVPERTIGAALGHSSGTVTSIYTRTDMRKKVDEANRKVIDYVLQKGNK
jgi:integrase